MTLHGAKLSLGVVALGAALSMVTALPGSASERTSTKGSNPNSAFCNLYKSETSQTSKSSKALEKDIEANNWKGAQKIIESQFSSEGNLVKEFIKVLSSAPANVRAAGAAALKVVPAEEKAVRTATSVAGYEKALEKEFNTAKLRAAGETFEKYETTECGSTAPTT
jgi:hypothetical protein